MALVIEEHRDRDVVYLTLIGELDIDTASELAERCLALRRAGADVRIDLSKIEFMDGFGVGVLHAAMSHAQLQHCGFEIEPHVRPRVRAVLHLVGVHVAPPESLPADPQCGRGRTR